MNDLRKAAEIALEYFENAHGLEDTEVAIKEALRQALDLQTAIERGTKAWADVPDATKWVEELRDNTPDCKTHPDAPHGFDRNASHSEDRYVCECEGWEPPKREWVGLTKEEFEQAVNGLEDLEDCWVQIEAKLREKNT